MELDARVIEQLERVGGQELLDELFSLFLTHTPKRIERVNQGLDSGELLQAEKAVHSLRSSCATVGARSLADEAGEVERLLAAGNLKAEEMWPGLESKVDELMSHLRQRLGRPRATEE